MEEEGVASVDLAAVDDAPSSPCAQREVFSGVDTCDVFEAGHGGVDDFVLARNISTPFTKKKSSGAQELDLPPAPRKHRISPKAALKTREAHLHAANNNESTTTPDNPDTSTTLDRQVLQGRSLNFSEITVVKEKPKREKQVRVKELEKYFRRLDVESCDMESLEDQDPNLASPKAVDVNRAFNLQRKRLYGEISQPATPAIDFKEQKRDWQLNHH